MRGDGFGVLVAVAEVGVEHAARASRSAARRPPTCTRSRRAPGCTSCRWRWRRRRPGSSPTTPARTGSSSLRPSSATAARVRPPRAPPRRCTNMSAQRCLTAWNEPIAAPNCSRSFAYAVASSTAREREAELQRAGEHDARRGSHRCGGVGVGDQLARRARRRSTIRDRRERVERALDALVVASAAGSSRRTPSSVEHEQHVEVVEVLDHRRPASDGSRSTDDRARRSAAPAIHAAARKVATSGPGTSARPSSSNTSTASDTPSSSPPSASGSVKENTPISPSSLPPVAVEATAGVLDRAHDVDREAAVEERAHRPPAGRPGRR